MKKNKVLIGAPLSNEEHNLHTYLDCIKELDYPKKLITLAWLVNNTTDETLERLNDFKELFGDKYNKVIIDYDPETVKNDVDFKRGFAYRYGAKEGDLSTCDLMARGKNWLKTCVTEESYVLYLEGDVYLIKDALKILIDKNKDIIGALCRTGDFSFNFMDRNGLAGWTRRPNWYPKETSKVDYLGGPVLYKSAIFRQLPFVKTRGVGEDQEAMNWCDKNGIDRWICPELKLQHDKWSVD